MLKVELGALGKDKITGFTGIINAQVDYLYGCMQYGLSPQYREGEELKEMEYFDEGRIEAIEPRKLEVNPDPWPSSLKLGNEVTDTVTGFKGIIVAFGRGCYDKITVAVTPEITKTGSIGKSEWFQVERLKLIGKGIAKEEVKGSRNGGVNRDAPVGRK